MKHRAVSLRQLNFLCSNVTEINLDHRLSLPWTAFTITGPDRTYHTSRYIFNSVFSLIFLAHSSEWAIYHRVASVCPSVSPSVCLSGRSKSLILLSRPTDHHQTCTQWSPGVSSSYLGCAQGQGRGQRSHDMGNYVVALKLLLLLGK